MKTSLCVGLLLAVTAAASGANLLTNGDFATGDETGWTRWRAGWGATENWAVAGGIGQLYGAGGDGSFGWFQAVPMPVGDIATVDATWTGSIGGAGWAEVMLYTSANPAADWGFLADTGAASDIAFKKDSWGMNPPTTWDWQPASMSPHPSGNGGMVVSQGYVAVAVKLGGFPMGSVNFEDVTLAPEPASAMLLCLGLPLLRRRGH